MKQKQRAARLSSDERKEMTVMTVIALAADTNPEDITTTTIAGRMRMTQGALFRHFATKDDIWGAVMEWVSVELLTLVDKAAYRQASPVDALEAVFMAHIDFVSRYPGVPRILFSELQRPGDTPGKHVVRALMGHYGDRLKAILTRGKAQKEFAHGIDDQAAVGMFIGSIQGLVMQSLLAGNIRRIRDGAPGVLALYLRCIMRSS